MRRGWRPDLIDSLGMPDQIVAFDVGPRGTFDLPLYGVGRVEDAERRSFKWHDGEESGRELFSEVRAEQIETAHLDMPLDSWEASLHHAETEVAQWRAAEEDKQQRKAIEAERARQALRESRTVHVRDLAVDSSTRHTC